MTIRAVRRGFGLFFAGCIAEGGGAGGRHKGSLMSFRLYENAWVQIDGVEQPVQAHKDPINRAAFNVGGYRYDIDARAMPGETNAPALVRILSLADIRDAGLQGTNRFG